MKPKCKKCGHAEADHASDHNHTETQPCWNGACTGMGCDCKDYQEVAVCQTTTQ